MTTLIGSCAGAFAAPGTVHRLGAALSAPEPISLLRVIARLSFGGATTQAIVSSRLLDPHYATTLAAGTTSPGEAEMTELLERERVTPVRLPALRREIGPHDARALGSMRRLMGRVRPALLHTHAAKAGAVARAAATLPGPGRPARVVHTYHGHTLRHYFSPMKEKGFVAVERALARRTDRLVVVAPQVRDELLEIGIGAEHQYRVIEDGFELGEFLAPPERRAAERARLRAELGIPDGAPVLTLIGRLVPVKRVDRFLRVAARLADVPDLRVLIVGDGELRDELGRAAGELGLRERVHWLGFRDDIPALCFASDAIALTSDAEGAPVSLIEAQAAGVPVVATDVGGTRSVVSDGAGFLADRDDEEALAAHARHLLEDPGRASALGEQARAAVAERFSTDRLRQQLLALYSELLDGG
jgi:glycosyltransferase involved in cell wall biosynthesis